MQIFSNKFIYRFYVVGGISAYGYITKFKPESFTSHPDFLSGNWTMDVLSTGNYDVASESGISISAASSQSVTTSGTSYTNQSIIYSQYSSTSVYYQINDQSLSVIENNNLIITPDLSCSPSGSTSIVYSISDYNGATAPSWITINSNSGELTIKAPDLNTDTEYDFYINSSISGISSVVQKIIKLTVKNCKVTMWLKWKSSDVNLCDIYQVSSQAQAIATTSQSIVGATSGVTAASSMMNSSSLTSLWSMINQVQMFFLLLLTRSFIPHDIEVTITGQGFAINPSDYVPLKSIGSSRNYIEKFKFELSNTQLEPVGINSDSTIFNIYPTVITILAGAIFHLIIYMISKILMRWKLNWWSWLTKALKGILNKILNILTFGFYIRTLLETQQFLLISAINEIYQFNTNGTLRIISLTFAIIVVYTYIFMFSLVFYLSFSSYKMIEKEHNKLGEFFAGLKLHKKFRLYILFLILRRTMFVVVLIVLVTFTSTTVIWILASLQLIYLTILLYLRPFEEVKGNLIEIINEIYILFLISPLIFLSTESKWVGPIQSIYIWTLSSNSMIVFLVIISKLIV